MGLLQAGMGAVGGMFADQWKEFIYCDSIDENVLAVKGKKRTSSQGRSSNTSAEDNIITQGSGIVVNDGQCMIIVEDGTVVEICSQPGRYTYDKSTSPSIFCDGLNKEGIMNMFEEVKRRFQYGGDPGKDQRVYYINTKEIIGNKYGTPSAVPFRVIDARINMDIEISVRCFGEYSYKIVNPILFYTKLCSNISEDYRRERIDGQLKTELMTALQPAFARMSEKGIRYSAIPAHTEELSEYLNEILSKKWSQLRGIEIVSFGVSSIKASEEDEQTIKDMQRAAVLSNPNMAGGFAVGQTGAAMRTAAGNSAGAMTGFMGMGMANGMMGGMNPAAMFQAGGQQPGFQVPPVQAQGYGAPQPAAPQPAAPQPAADGWTCSCGATNTGKFCNECGSPKPAPKPAAGSWTCSCGTVNTGKFCNECGKPAPKPAEEWTCSCGAVNKGKFCNECGNPKPAGAWTCPECGQTGITGKFCPECGHKN